MWILPYIFTFGLGSISFQTKSRTISFFFVSSLLLILVNCLFTRTWLVLSATTFVFFFSLTLDDESSVISLNPQAVSLRLPHLATSSSFELFAPSGDSRIWKLYFINLLFAYYYIIFHYISTKKICAMKIW